ncbi:mannosyl-oligosaccharide alpha-1,2-mannosidase [Aspergillus luchuensis]|uniref:Mannosyl-oligosaccharide alpha-1,2-mannosidase n=1 Tax=Aspergillus kawachii TaxID=1069201 RepID=A0A146FAA6_ASPKA|nr:mannosyl-oligosaccharide alpha-1,2-mannosidase [Aspergillus luchuensis]
MWDRNIDGITMDFIVHKEARNLCIKVARPSGHENRLLSM